jgi:hypothetical protein
MVMIIGNKITQGYNRWWSWWRYRKGNPEGGRYPSRNILIVDIMVIRSQVVIINTHNFELETNIDYNFSRQPVSRESTKYLSLQHASDDYRLEFWETTHTLDSSHYSLNSYTLDSILYNQNSYTLESSLYSWNANRKIHRKAQESNPSPTPPNSVQHCRGQTSNHVVLISLSTDVSTWLRIQPVICFNLTLLRCDK